MEGKSNQKKTFVTAAIAGLLAIVGTVIPAGSAQAEDVKCSGINGCAGQADCGGKDSACAGRNACKGQGWTNVASAEECIVAGGELVSAETAEEAEEEQAEEEAVMRAEANS